MNVNIDQLLLDRIRNVLIINEIEWEEKKMFGGVCFMVDDKMCFGSYKGGLMLRINPKQFEEFLKSEGLDQMIHGGRTMKGFLFAEPIAYERDDQLEYWIVKCLEFNPLAKASKKKTKKKK